MESPLGLRLQRDDMSLRKLAENTLRDAILYGAFTPGQKLIERDLCDRLGVSRTLLREALKQLEAEADNQRGPQGPVSCRDHRRRRP